MPAQPSQETATTHPDDVLLDISTSLSALAGASAPPTELAGEVLARLRLELPYDGASLESFDPSTRTHRVLADVDPPESLRGEDVHVGGERPSPPNAEPKAWPITGPRADGTWPPLTEHRDGLSAGLYARDDRYTGVLHLRLNQPQAAIELIGRIAPLLAGLVDVLRIPSQLAADAPLERSAAVVLPDASVLALPARPTSPLLEDGAALPRAIAEAHQRDELPDRFQWRDAEGSWHAVAARPTGNGVVVTLDPGELPCGLTTRELEVLTLVVGGLSNPQIAELLDVTGKTVAKHVEHLLAKLAVQSRAAAAAQAVRLGLIELATISEP